MDETRGGGSPARRAAPKASADSGAGGAKAGAKAGTSAAAAAPPDPATGGAGPATARSARPAKAPPGPRAARAPRTTSASRSPGASRPGRADRAGPEPAGGQEGGPWRGPRGWALYSRRIQRANERWPLASRMAAGLLSRPELVLRALGQREVVERDGRMLNRGVQAMLQLADRFEGSADGLNADPAELRAQLRRSTKLAMPVRTDVHAWDRVVPGQEGAPPVPVRLYRPYGSGLGLGGRPLPGIVYYHGGSWVSGDLDTHDGTCRLLAATARCLVVAVDYRLAPEDPFPAGVSDAVAAYVWVQRHADELGVDRRQVGVMGDSAGGNLAAVVALEVRAGGPMASAGVLPPSAQGLVYPVVDARLDTDTVRNLGDDFFLTRDAMEQARGLYLPDPSDWTAWRASPLLAEDHRGAAPALVVTAGFDPLRDDGSNYAEALRKAGVAVEYRCYDDQIHGFMGMGILPESLALATEVCDAMGRLVRGPAESRAPA